MVDSAHVLTQIMWCQIDRLIFFEIWIIIVYLDASRDFYWNLHIDFKQEMADTGTHDTYPNHVTFDRSIEKYIFFEMFIIVVYLSARWFYWNLHINFLNRKWLIRAHVPFTPIMWRQIDRLIFFSKFESLFLHFHVLRGFY